MRHRVYGQKLGRKTNHRKAMWRNMAVSLLMHEQITTTVPKARSLKPFVERLINVAKKGDLAARRQAMSMLGDDRVMVREEDDPDVPRNRYGEIERKGGRKQGPRIIKHLFEEIGPRYTDRNGGYTRIVKLGRHRIGDGADLCVIQLVSDEDTGPQVAGHHSRRREKANKRMEYAARLRKGGSAAAVAEQEDGEKKKGQDPDVSEDAEESRAEPGSPSEQQQDQPSESPEPREGDTAEGDKDKE